MSSQLLIPINSGNHLQYDISMSAMESHDSISVTADDSSLYLLHKTAAPSVASISDGLPEVEITTQQPAISISDLSPTAILLPQLSSSSKSLRIPTLGGRDLTRSELKGGPVLNTTNVHGAYQNNNSSQSARRLNSFNSSDTLNRDNESVYSEIASSFSNNFLLNFVHKENPLKAGGLGKEYWLDDSSATKCFLCEKSFTTFRRKHHCRICGQIFCSSCTLFVSGEKFNHKGKMRVCKSCLAYADKYDDMAASSDESLLEENNNNANESIYPSKSNETGTSSLHQSLRTGNYLEQEVLIHAPTPPPRMAIPATRSGAAVEIPSRDLIQRNNSFRRRRQRFSQSNHNFRSGILANNQRLTVDDETSISTEMNKGHSNNLKYLQQGTPSSSPNIFIFGQHKNRSNSTVSPLVHDPKPLQSSSPSFKSPAPVNKTSKIEDSEDESEDEKSISLYETLRGDDCKSSDLELGLFNSRSSSQLRESDVRTRLSRLNSQTRSERAQASLWRMKNRRRAKTTSRLTPTSYQVQQYMNGLHRSKTVNFEEDAFKNLIDGNKQTTFDFSGVSEESPDLHSGTGQLNKLTAGSSLNQRVVSMPNRDLKNFMEAHCKALLKQSLIDEGLDNLSRWETTLFNILKQVGDIHPDIRRGENFDIRQFLKLKRVFGALIEDSTFIDGIVFSKNVALKSMPKELTNPKICLIMFPIEYTKSEQHFMSLDLVMAQEKESLHKLVGRIIALNPDILFVGDSISGLALEMLDNAGITVVYNLKPQVIERISKLTDADVVTSIDKLAVNPKVGTCDFFEVRQYLYEGIKRSYIILSGCNKSNGATILLRGGNQQLLKKVKSSVEFLIYVFFNLNFEYSLFKDGYLTVVDQDTPKLDNFSSSYYSDFIERLKKRSLSSSAVIKFYLPPLLYKAREEDDKLKSVMECLSSLRLKRSQVLELEKNELLVPVSESGNKLNPLGFDYSNSSLESSVDIENVDVANLNEFRIAEYILQQRVESFQLNLYSWQRQWELFYSHSPYLLDPTSHQSLLFLYTMVNSKTTAPCVGPETLKIDYYWMSDISLGQYIEQIALTANADCPEGCGNVLMEHFRSYVHGNGKVDVIVEPFQSRILGLQNVILMWSYCKECRQSTPVLPMSENTSRYSFGKYLELSFWSENIKLIGTCPHDFKQHIRYFGIYNLAVRMEYSKVDTLELVVPKFKLHWKPDIDIKLKFSSLENIREKTKAFFDSIWERLIRVKVDSMTIDKMETGQKRIQELKEKVQLDKIEITKMTNDIYEQTEVTEHLPLNAVVRKIQELSVQWDMEFQDFELNFLPSEKDITRITSSQLRKAFMDKEPHDTIKEPDSNTIVVKDDIPNMGNEFDKEIKEAAATDLELELAKKERSSKPVLGPHVSEQIHKMEAILSDQNHLEKSESKPELSPIKDKFHSLKLPVRSFSEGAPKLGMNTSSSGLSARLPRLGTNELELELRKDNSEEQRNNSNGKVKQLTSLFDQLHFDQISMEFELQRERERRKLIANRYRAIPVITSRPIVEVYKNVHDAVEEELSDDESNPKDLKKKLPSNGEDGGTIKREEEGELKGNDKDLRKQSGMPQIERASLIKTLTSFWADRSAALWKPLAYPLSSSEHIFVDSDVIVREDEPSSLIAFCLSSSDYVSKLKNIRENTPITNNNSDILSVKKQSQRQVTVPNVTDGNTVLPETSGDLTSVLEKIMLKKTAIHLKYQFQEGSSLLSCKIFFAEQFDAFRQECGIDDNFVQSLSRCVKWDSTGGKSGSAFLKTLDDRFIIKELSHTELDAFVKFAPSYFEYLAQALFHDLPTVLAKIFGFYQIHIRNPIDNKNIKIDLLIMENLFYDRKTSRIFDLKGSMRNRHVEQTGKANEVLLDENMVEYIYESPLFVKEYAKKLLRTSLWNDTLFLSRMNVMDYSLVIGIDTDNQELVVGIIDCIRTFTWDKKLESWVKEKGLVGGGGKEPTVVTPRQYKNRFRDAMDRYILMVPDCWNQGIIE